MQGAGAGYLGHRLGSPFPRAVAGAAHQGNLSAEKRDARRQPVDVDPGGAERRGVRAALLARRRPAGQLQSGPRPPRGANGGPPWASPTNPPFSPFFFFFSFF